VIVCWQIHRFFYQIVVNLYLLCKTNCSFLQETVLCHAERRSLCFCVGYHFIDLKNYFHIENVIKKYTKLCFMPYCVPKRVRLNKKCVNKKIHFHKKDWINANNPAKEC
jgi:hypothetical protein